MKVEGSVYPQEREYLKGKILVNFDVEEKTKIDENGNTVTYFEYEQLRLNPPMDEEAIAKEVAKYQLELKRETALKYLVDTDWIVVKISEVGLDGGDVESLKAKYAAEIANRAVARTVLNTL